MKIYKFKDLICPTARPHFAQIIQENKLWCAAPHSLNDDAEFQFQFDYEPSSDTEELLAGVVSKFGQSHFPPGLVANYGMTKGKLEEIVGPIVADVIRQCRNSIGVTSFSTVGHGGDLWDEYGGNGCGARIEFDLEDESVGKTFHLVDYVSERFFHIDVFLKSQLSNAEDIFRKILCTKTKKWQGEREIRFIGKRPNVNITLDAPISNVTFGRKVPTDILNEYTAICRRRGLRVSRLR